MAYEPYDDNGITRYREVEDGPREYTYRIDSVLWEKYREEREAFWAQLDALRARNAAQAAT